MEKKNFFSLFVCFDLIPEHWQSTLFSDLFSSGSVHTTALTFFGAVDVKCDASKSDSATEKTMTPKCEQVCLDEQMFSGLD